MSALSIQDLIDRAEAVLRPTLVRDRWFADVAAAIETDTGNVYVGVCLDTGATGSWWTPCATSTRTSQARLARMAR